MAPVLLNPYRFGGGGGGGGSYASEVLADSPVVYWRQGDPSGSTMTDSSGNARHGTYAVAPTLGATGLLVGDADTAANFQGGGSGGYGEMASASWMNVTDLTLEVWIKPDQVSAQANVVIRDDGGAGRDWILRTTSAGKIDFAVWNTGGTLYQLIPTTVLSAGNTYHIVGTFDGTNQKVYINGTQAGTQACSGDVRALTQMIQLGGPGSRFDGIIDEVAIYGTALSSTRVSDHYASGT